jgi:hypothetical protein
MAIFMRTSPMPGGKMPLYLQAGYPPPHAPRRHSLCCSSTRSIRRSGTSQISATNT